MPQQPSQSGKAAERGTAWRDRLLRHASSGQTVAAFCQSESVSVASFYNWRSKLRARQAPASVPPRTIPEHSPFIDLGALDASASLKRPAADQAAALGRAAIDVRIDLGCGVLLTITRH